MIDGGIGHRAVAFSVNATGGGVTVRTMISQRTTENIYGWNAGVQTVRKDDFVAISSWTPKTSKTQVFRKTTKGLVPIRNWGGSFNSRLIEKLPKCIIEFLKPKGGGPSYLPSGPWRANYDMNKTLDRDVILKFLHPYLAGDWLDYTVQEASKAPEQHLSVDWNSRKVQALPTTLDAHEEFWTDSKEPDSNVRVHNSMVWILIHRDGTVTTVEPEPTSGFHYVGNSRRIIETFKALPQQMPSTVVRAIKLNLGAYEKDEVSYGARWFLYKR